jgi:hypothetical protein
MLTEFCTVPSWMCQDLLHIPNTEQAGAGVPVVFNIIFLGYSALCT